MLEEEFLELMVMLFRSLPVDDIWQTDAQSAQNMQDDQDAEIQQCLQASWPTLALVGTTYGIL